MPDWGAIWNSVSTGILVCWAAISSGAVMAWSSLSTGTEIVVRALQPHPDAVAGSLYLSVVIGLAVAYLIVHPEYAYYSLRRHGFGKKAARHVWYLTLMLLLASGLIHAADRAAIHLDVVTPPIPFDLLPGTKLALVVNTAISFVALASYLWHIYNRRVNLVRGFRPFFTPVFGLFGAEHLIGIYWEHYDLNRATALSLTFLSRIEGPVILRSVIAAVLGLALVCTVQLYVRHRSASPLGPAEPLLD
jgi:hypothetical protein